MEELAKTLGQMGTVFSSNQFSAKAIRNGIIQQQVNNGVLSAFLHENCIQLSTKRMWRKKTDDKNVVVFSSKTEEAISLLKSKGYKIMKPINEYVEV